MASDPNNCGECDRVCANGSCVGGACSCTAPFETCGGECANTQFDPTHCGVCARACRDSELCAAGACVCRPGLQLYGGNCIDPLTDARHCGGTAGACSGSRPKCENGECVASCSGGTTDCSDGCVTTATASLNCGTCGRRCLAAEVCIEGECYAYRATASSSCTPSPCVGTEFCCFYPHVDPPTGPAMCVAGAAPRCP